MNIGCNLYLNGSLVPLPVEYPDLKIKLISGGYFSNPTIDVESLTLINEGVKVVTDWVDSGKLFQPLPAKMELIQGDKSFVFFDGYIDLTQEFTIIDPDHGSNESPVQCQCKFVPYSSRESLQELISGTTFGLINEQKVFKSSDFVDVDFVIESDFDPITYGTTIFVLFTLQDKAKELLFDIQKEVAEIIAIANDATGAIAVIIYKIILATLKTVYFLTLITLIVELSIKMATTFVSPLYKHKTISYFNLISKTLASFGYVFASPIEELKDYYFLPSNQNDNSDNVIKAGLPFPSLIKNPLPRVTDGTLYTVEGFLTHVLTMFDAVISVKDKVITMRSKSDVYWTAPSDVTIQDVRTPTKQYNSDAIKKVEILEFATDVLDGWTLRNYKGTSYEIWRNVEGSNLKGLERKSINVGLVSRKSELNLIEKTVKQVLQVCESIISIIGSKKDLTKYVTDRIGAIKFNEKMNGTARVIYLKNGKIPSNHRDKLSAKYLWQKYHQNTKQRVMYANVTNVPFTLAQLLSLIDASKLNTSKGVGYLIDASYSLSEDCIDLSFEVDQNYLLNLSETKIEA